MAKSKKNASKKKAAKKPIKAVQKKKTITKRKAASAPRKKAAKKPVRKSAAPAGLTVLVPPPLEARLRFLAGDMGKSVEALLTQALNEFAENWEDHMRTVNALNENDDRVQLSVPVEQTE